MIKNLKTISAYEARKNFGELINLAYYNNYEIVVEKMGRPMVKIIKVILPKRKMATRSEIMAKYAGVWSINDSKEILNSTKSFRKNFKILN